MVSRVRRQSSRKTRARPSSGHVSSDGLLRRVRSVTEGLTKSLNIERVLHELLTVAAEIAGGERGAAYLVEPDGTLSLRAHLHCAASVRARLADFFGFQDWLRAVVEARELRALPGGMDGPGVPRLLTEAQAQSLLVVPLSLGKDRMGALVLLASKAGMEDKAESFTPAVCLELGHAVALARAIYLSSSSEQRFRTLVEGLDAIVWEADPASFQFTYVSRHAEKILRYPAERWLREPDFWVNHIHPEDRSWTVTYCRKGVSEGRDHEFEYRMLAADGRPVWLRDIVRMVKDDRGRVQLLRGLMIDITERRRTGRALEERTASLSALVQNAPLAVVVLDAQHRVQVCNPAFERLFQYQQAEIVGAPLDELIAPPELGAEASDLTQQVLAGSVIQRTTRRRRKDGTLMNVQVYGVPLVVDDELIGVYALYEDITPRVQAEEALRASEERYRLLFETNPHPMWVYDLETLAFLAVNEAAIQHYGYSRAEFLSMTIADIRPPEDIPRLLENFSRVRSGVDAARVDAAGVWRHRTKDGTLIEVEVVSHALQFDGRPAELVLADDVTERKRTEKLQAAVYRIAQAADRAATLDDLYRSVHEIVQEVMPASNFYISIYDDKAGTLSFPYFVDERDETPAPMKPGRGLTAYVLRSGQPLLCTLERHQELEQRGEIELVGSQAPIWVGVPLRKGEKTIGVMVVQHYSDPKAYGEPELAVLSYVSSQIAQAIDRKRAEQALRESEAQFRALTETTASAILISRGDKFLYVNPAAEAIIGYSSGELHGKSFYDIIHPDFRQLVRDRRAARLGGEAAPPRYEIKVITKSGEERWVDLTATVIELEGKPAVLGTAFDITERALAEEALRRSEANYRSLVANAPYGIYRVNREGRMLAVNPALVEMLGYDSEEELLRLNEGRDIYREPADRDRLVERHWGGDGFGGIEVMWKKKDGTFITVQLAGRPVPDEHGEVLYAEVVAQDVTERRALEQQLRQAQKMEAVGRLAGGIAHDFNNLLMVIGGHTDMIRRRLGPESPVDRNAHEIQRAAERAASLTQQLLAFSRKQMVQPRVLDLNVVVADMESMLRRLIGEHIEFVTSLAADLGRVLADEAQIEQVVLNLGLNARDAMPHGGRLLVETANTALDEEYARQHAGARPGPYVLLAVHDTGVGMDKETQAQIFEPFFTTKEVGKGTGLGLSTVYGIVKQSGGYIWVESALGRGSTFQVYLPHVEAEAEPERVEAPAEGVQRGGETILVVEDEAALRKLAREFLEGNGYRVLEAENGADALRVADAHGGRIHALVTDVVMPAMPGRELAERLTALRPDTRVLFMSGYTDDVRLGRLGPGQIFLQKPFTLDTLVRKLRELLRVSRPG